MLQWIKNRASFILVTVLALSFVGWFYGQVFFSPNSYIFTYGGDGLKNYYTYAYHIEHSESYTEFDGMHYPFGEHVAFTDAQPLLAWLVKPFPFLHPYKIGIMHFCMLMSYVVGAIFLYLLLLRFKVNEWLAVFGAIAITMLAPQIFRLGGHQSLSYACFFPVGWYLLLRFFDAGNKWKWSGYVALHAFLWFFIHAYIGMILLLFMGAVWLIYLLSKWKTEARNKKNYGYFAIQVIAPLLLFQLFMLTTDTHPDRTTEPSGFFKYHADPETVFLPSHKPFQPHTEEAFPLKERVWEGWAYVGITTIVMLLLALGYVLQTSIKRKKVGFHGAVFEHQMPIYLIAGFLLLLFSMCYPFRWGMEELADWVAPIKQFRSLGRFAWVFFYVSTIFSVVMLNYLFQRLKGKETYYVGYAIVIFSIGLYGYESLWHHKDVLRGIIRAENMFEKDELPDAYQATIKKIDAKKYQAMIALPYFNYGSEVYAIGGTEKSKLAAFFISYHTGLPLLNNSSARTSISESSQAIAFLSPAYHQRKAAKLFRNKKPFLVLHTKEWLPPVQQELLYKAKRVYENEEHILYEIPYSVLLENGGKKVKEDFDRNKHNFDVRTVPTSSHQILVSDSSAFVYFEDFDGWKNKISYRHGKGALTNFGQYNILTRLPFDTLSTEQEYVASCWFYGNGKKLPAMIFRVEEKTLEEQVIMRSDQHAGGIETVDGQWYYAEVKFKITNPSNHVQVHLIKMAHDYKSWYVDNLMVRPANVNVYIEYDDGTLLYNNRYVKP
jgi:hypothetical protein